MVTNLDTSSGKPRTNAQPNHGGERRTSCNPNRAADRHAARHDPDSIVIYQQCSVGVKRQTAARILSVQSPHRGPGWPAAGGWLRRSPRDNCTSLSRKRRAPTPHGGSAASITWRAGKPGAARLGDPFQKYSSMRRATGETRRCSKGTKKKTALGERPSPKGREFGDKLKAGIPAPQFSRREIPINRAGDYPAGKDGVETIPALPTAGVGGHPGVGRGTGRGQEGYRVRKLPASYWGPRRPLRLALYVARRSLTAGARLTSGYRSG